MYYCVMGNCRACIFDAVSFTDFVPSFMGAILTAAATFGSFFVPFMILAAARLIRVLLLFFVGLLVRCPFVPSMLPPSLSSAASVKVS